MPHSIIASQHCKQQYDMEILIEGMEFYAYHGFYAEENKIGARYTVDLRLTVPDASGSTDLLSTTVNYEQVYALVSREMARPSKLIEHVATRIINALQASFPAITHTDLTLYKYNPPLGGKLNRVGIHLVN